MPGAIAFSRHARDGPRIFITRNSAGNLLFAYQCDQSSDLWRYLLVPCSDLRLAQFSEGKISIVQMLNQPWDWVADIRDGSDIESMWVVDPAVLPDDYRPQPNVYLTHVSEPELSVRYVGASFHEQSVPLSVIRTASERVTAAFRGLVDFVGNRLHRSAFSEKESRDLADVRVHGVLLASFQLAIDIPDSSDQRHQTIWQEVRRLLERAVQWGADPELIDRASDSDPEEDVAVLQAIESLAPTGRTEVEEVQLGGRLVSRLRPGPVPLRKETRRRVQSSIKNKVSKLEPESRFRQWPSGILAVGRLTAADKSLNTFYLRDVGPVYDLDQEEPIEGEGWPYGDMILFSYDPEKWKNSVVESFTSERKIFAIGKLVRQADVPDGVILAYSIPQYELINLQVPTEPSFPLE